MITSYTFRASQPKITQDLIQRGRYGRCRIRLMAPKYITLHSTQNYSRAGNARAHAHMLQHGVLKGRKNSLGYHRG